MTRLTGSLIAALLALASGAQAQAAGNDPVRGKAAWSRAGCYACHGYAAQGSETTGPQLSGREWTFDIFNQLVRHPANTMPAYSPKMLSDAEMLDLMAYVNGIKVKNR